MKVFKTIGDISLVLLAALSCVIMVAFVFYEYFGPTTVGVNNVGDQLALDVVKADDLSAEEKSEYEERWFLEANYYSNDKNNGIELQELKFNYFMTHKLTQADYRSTGMQYVGDYESYLHKYNNDIHILPDFTFYDTTDGVTWSGYSKNVPSSTNLILNRDANLIIKIDGKPFSICLDKSYQELSFERRWYTLWLKEYEVWTTINYDYGDLFECVFNAIESNSAGYGDYYVTLDLSQFFTIKEYTEDGKFKEDNVTDIIKNYAVLKFHYDENGAIRSSQSLFGKIECNSKYDYSGVEFWDGRMVYTLTEEDIDFRYSEGYNGNFISIKQETKDLFKSMPKVKLIIDINLTNKNVIGFDYLAFSDLKIDTLKITGAESLKVMESSFNNATLNKLVCSDALVFDGEFGIEYERGAI